VVYREFFPRGLSALDDRDEQTLGTPPSMVYMTARREVEALLASLKLPIDECGRRRAEARAQWLTTAGRPLEMHDILAE
jgi:chromosome partitioning protein